MELSKSEGIGETVPGLTYGQFRNLLAFVALMNGESSHWLKVSPDYLIEKYQRYLGAGGVYREPPDTDAWQSGLHPALRALTNRYCEQWGITMPDE